MQFRVPRGSLMQRIHFGLICGLICLGGAEAVVADTPQIKKGDVTAADTELTSLSWTALSAKLESAPDVESYSEKKQKLTRESVLIEIVRRGGGDAQKVISQMLADMDIERQAEIEALKDRADDDIETIADSFDLAEKYRSLELITALRRVQKQPDPLAVLVDSPDELKATLRQPPVLKVALKNVDADRRSFSIQQGGDYRSGRHARWRILVWNSNGDLLPELPSASMIGGGIYNISQLNHGDQWTAQLNLGSYVHIRKPGKYKVQVIYHDRATIADAESLNPGELILFRSEPFELNVEHGPKIPIELTNATRDKSRSLIKSLNENNTLRILVGQYDKDMHDFISPTSPQGQLLSLEWQSVPALMESLEDKSLTYRKRAWVLSLLYSITLEPHMNPAKRDEGDLSGLLVGYEMRGSGWWSGRSGGGKPNVEAQLKLAKEWLQFRTDYLDIKVKTDK